MILCHRLFHISTWPVYSSNQHLIPRSPVSRYRSHRLDKARRCYRLTVSLVLPNNPVTFYYIISQQSLSYFLQVYTLDPQSSVLPSVILFTAFYIS